VTEGPLWQIVVCWLIVATTLGIGGWRLLRGLWRPRRAGTGCRGACCPAGDTSG